VLIQKPKQMAHPRLIRPTARTFLAWVVQDFSRARIPERRSVWKDPTWRTCDDEPEGGANEGLAIATQFPSDRRNVSGMSRLGLDIRVHRIRPGCPHSNGFFTAPGYCAFKASRPRSPSSVDPQFWPLSVAVDALSMNAGSLGPSIDFLLHVHK
jgi:hypothetical protein